MTTPTATYFKTANNTLDGGTVTLTGATVGQRVVAVTATDFGAAADLTTPTGTAVSTWTLEQTSSVGASAQPQMKAWSGAVTTAGGTVTGAGPSGSAFALIVALLSGVDTSDFPDDDTEAHSTGTHTSAHTAAAATPSGTDDLLIVEKIAADSDGGVTTTTGSTTNTAGMTSRSRVTYDSGATRYMDVEAFDQVLAASGSTGTRAMVYGDTCDYATVTVAVKGSAGGTPATITPAAAAATGGVTSPALSAGRNMAVPPGAATAGITPPAISASGITNAPSAAATGGSTPPTVAAAATIQPAPAGATAGVTAPAVTAPAATAPSAGEAVGAGTLPILTAAVVLAPDAGNAVGSIASPSIQAGGSVTISPAAAGATGGIANPTVTAAATVDPPAAAANASVTGPLFTAPASLLMLAAAAVAAITDPVITGGGADRDITVTATLADPSWAGELTTLTRWNAYLGEQP